MGGQGACRWVASATTGQPILYHICFKQTLSLHGSQPQREAALGIADKLWCVGKKNNTFSFSSSFCKVVRTTRDVPT